MAHENKVKLTFVSVTKLALELSQARWLTCPRVTAQPQMATGRRAAELKWFAIILLQKKVADACLKLTFSKCTP